MGYKNIRIKPGVDLSVLRNFGFEMGSKLVERHPYSEVIQPYEYDWWHICQFPTDKDGNPIEDEYGEYVAESRCWVDTRDGENLLWFDVMAESNYHVGMSDLNLITNVIHALTKADLIITE